MEGLEEVDILLKEGEVRIVSTFGLLSELGRLEYMQCLQNRWEREPYLLLVWKGIFTDF
jgi:hypothetical protein